MIKTTNVSYRDNDTRCEGFYAYEDTHPAKRPGILVVHDWSGRNEFAETKAKQLAELGYLGFAVDMYGEGKTGTTTEEKVQLIKPLMENRALLRQRILSALECINSLEQVDTNKIGAIGFCFGGLCVLDLARAGAAIKGVVSFHGLLNAPEPHPASPIRAKVLALHGHNDPMVPPEQVLAFETEMTKANADWQVHVYGNTQHAFTNPNAHDEKMGTVYNRLAEKRSLLAMQHFFTEVFSE